MPDTDKGLRYRCPVCFARENDVVLHQRANGSYYCVKCSFWGSREEILNSYSALKKKYHNLTKRITLEEIRKL